MAKIVVFIDADKISRDEFEKIREQLSRST